MLQVIERDEYWFAGQNNSFYQFYLQYQDCGELFSISNNKGKVIYQHMLAEDSEKLRQQVKERLIEQSAIVLKNIGDLLDDQKVWYIGIYLPDDPDRIVNPFYQPGLQRIRDEHMANKEDLWLIWYLGEQPVYCQGTLESNELLEQSRLLVQYWQVTGDGDWWNKSKKLWGEVAFELNLHAWGHVLPITNDFVIFAAYDELNISEGDLERSIPEEKILMLKNIGLLE
jgi:hypothetical protein